MITPEMKERAVYERWCFKTEPAAAQSRRGDTRPLEVDAVMLRVQQRLRQQVGDR